MMENKVDELPMSFADTSVNELKRSFPCNINLASLLSYGFQVKNPSLSNSINSRPVGVI